MTIQPILPGLYSIPAGQVNCFLFVDGSDLILIDAGYPGQETTILNALAEIDHKPADIRYIILTHFHPDHAGGLVALKRASGAQAWMHSLDAAQARIGNYHRPSRPGPGLLPRLIYQLFIANARSDLPPAVIENELQDGMLLPFAGGLRVVHTPGHTAGHASISWEKHGGALIAGDLVAHVAGLGWSPIYEDFGQNLQSLQKISRLDYQTVLFSHGKPIRKDGSMAMRRFYSHQKDKHS